MKWIDPVDLINVYVLTISHILKDCITFRTLESDCTAPASVFHTDFCDTWFLSQLIPKTQLCKDIVSSKESHIETELPLTSSLHGVQHKLLLFSPKNWKCPIVPQGAPLHSLGTVGLGPYPKTFCFLFKCFSLLFCTSTF